MARTVLHKFYILLRRKINRASRRKGRRHVPVVEQPLVAVEVNTVPSLSSVDELPVEILLHIFACMPLNALIISRGICREWRRLVPLANLLPDRRRLLEFYDTIINSPTFPECRPWTVVSLKPFDRQAYIGTLLKQHRTIPEAFRLWILEWPARLAIRCEWPGLPYVVCQRDTTERSEGVNFLGNLPPQLSAVTYKQHTPRVEFIPGLLTWRSDAGTFWLIFDERPNLCGRVFVLYPHVPPATITIYPDDDHDVDEEIDYAAEDGGSHDDFFVYPDWISYEIARWEFFKISADNSRTAPQLANMDYSDLPPPPPNDTFTDQTPHRRYLPAHPWNRRHEPLFQGRLRTS